MNLTDKNYNGVKAFLIARVSDPSQREALPAQELRLNRYADEKGFSKELFSFDETAYKEDRQKFEEISRKIANYPEFCVVIFDKIDRFTRDGSSESVRLFKDLAKQGKLEMHFPSDNLIYHKNSPAVDITHLGMGMVFGEYYSAAISDNVKRKIEQKLHDGEWPGKAPIGYINIANADGRKDIVKDPERYRFIRRAFELRCEQKPFSTIARILRENGFTSNTIQRKPVNSTCIVTICSNPFYYGMMRHSGKVLPHKYEPIIDRALFNHAQEINSRLSNNKVKTETKRQFIFRGILKCALCGSTISPYEQKGRVYMQCGAKGSTGCKNHVPPESVVMEEAVKALDSANIGNINTENILERLQDRHNDVQLYYKAAIENTKKDYEKLKSRNQKLYDDRLDGRITIDEYDNYAKKNRLEMDKLNTQISQLSNNDNSFNIDAAYLLKLAQNARRLFESSRIEQKNEILKLVFSNLEWNQKRLQFNLLEPFATLASGQENNFWLRRPDSNRRPIG